MADYLLAYFSADFTERSARELRLFVEDLSTQGAWSQPPQFIDQFEQESGTRTEDQPIRTVGAAFPVNTSDEARTPVGELGRFVDALAAFSSRTGVEFELQLGETYVSCWSSGPPRP